MACLLRGTLSPNIMKQNNNLSICSFNCRSVKNSVYEIQSLCDKYDVVLIQEHWLLPNELEFLNNIHPDFLAYGHSAVDISQGILIGRPYGGTAILYRKTLSTSISRLLACNDRVTAVTLHTEVGPVLIACVYMPTDYGSPECVEEYIATCASVTACGEPPRHQVTTRRAALSLDIRHCTVHRYCAVYLVVRV